MPRSKGASSSDNVGMNSKVRKSKKARDAEKRQREEAEKRQIEEQEDKLNKLVDKFRENASKGRKDTG